VKERLKRFSFPAPAPDEPPDLRPTSHPETYSSFALTTAIDLTSAVDRQSSKNQSSPNLSSRVGESSRTSPQAANNFIEKAKRYSMPNTGLDIRSSSDASAMRNSRAKNQSNPSNRYASDTNIQVTHFNDPPPKTSSSTPRLDVDKHSHGPPPYRPIPSSDRLVASSDFRNTQQQRQQQQQQHSQYSDNRNTTKPPLAQKPMIYRDYHPTSPTRESKSFSYKKSDLRSNENIASIDASHSDRAIIDNPRSSRDARQARDVSHRKSLGNPPDHLPPKMYSRTAHVSEDNLASRNSSNEHSSPSRISNQRSEYFHRRGEQFDKNRHNTPRPKSEILNSSSRGQGSVDKSISDNIPRDSSAAESTRQNYRGGRDTGRTSNPPPAPIRTYTVKNPHVPRPASLLDVTGSRRSTYSHPSTKDHPRDSRNFQQKSMSDNQLSNDVISPPTTQRIGNFPLTLNTASSTRTAVTKSYDRGMEKAPSRPSSRPKSVYDNIRTSYYDNVHATHSDML